MFRGFHEGMGAGGWVLMVLFWGTLVALVVWAVARIAPSHKVQAPERSIAADEPLSILDRRLATGEIDAETYDQLRSTLSAGAAGKG
jgi:putative membrane protein